MTIHRYLTVSDIGSDLFLREYVHPLCPAALYLAPGTTPSPEELDSTTLIIATDRSEDIQPLLDQDLLSPSTPILFLGEGPFVPPWVKRHSNRLLLDYLVIPVPEEVFRHRISLLCRMQKMSVEHHTSSTTLSRQLDVLSTRDGLTGLYNRRHLTTNLLHIMDSARVNNEDLSLLLLNIDFFNNVNKTSGQKYGDFILNEMGARLTSSSRKGDSCYRFSGEDFVVLQPQTSLEESKKITEKIRKICSDKPFVHGETTQHITVSIGLVSLQNHFPASADEFLSMAETALFMAKAKGRNRIQIYKPITSTGQFTPKKSMAFLRDSLQRIMERTRSSAVESVQLLAKNVAGPGHQAHAVAVSRYINLLGQQLGLPMRHVEVFHNAITLCNSFRSLLHNDLISKPEQLSFRERKIIDDLPFKLTEITDMFDYFADERQVLLCLGERYDGTGTPRGLRGAEIPIGARIFTLVDAVAAMNADRPYRRRLTAEEIVLELYNGAGRQFDPLLVYQLLTVIENNQLLNPDKDILERVRRDLLNTFPDINT